MAVDRVPGQINPEIVSHLAQAMDSQLAPAPISLDPQPEIPQQRQWPDGSGKHKHPRDEGQSHGRAGQEAAVTAVHRTGRPQMPHSS